MVGDLCTALEGKIVSYCDTILQATSCLRLASVHGFAADPLHQLEKSGSGSEDQGLCEPRARSELAGVGSRDDLLWGHSDGHQWRLREVQLEVAVFVIFAKTRYLGPVVQMLREASSTRHALTLPALAPSGDSSGSARLADGPDSEEWIECLRIVRDIWMFAGEVISIKVSRCCRYLNSLREGVLEACAVQGNQIG